MSEANKTIVRRNFEEVWNCQNFAVVDEIHAPGYVGHIASAPEEIRGRDHFKHFIAIHRLAFPDIHFIIEDQLAEGDKVATHWTARGTHLGEFMGMMPSGHGLIVTGISIHRLAGGRIEESWDNWDALSLLQGLNADVLELVSLQV